MHIARNMLNSNKLWDLRSGIHSRWASIRGCRFAGAPRKSRLEKNSETSKSGGSSVHCNTETGENVCERNYVTSATTSSVHTTVLSDIPEVRGLSFFATPLSLLAPGNPKKLHEYVDRRHKELGPIFKDQIGPVKAIFISSPHEYRRIFRLEGQTPKHFLPESWMLYNEIRGCRRGLLFMDGEEWLHFRRILNRVMLVPDPIDVMIGPCQETAKDLAKKWKSQIQSNNIIEDLQAELYQWSIEAVLATLMGSTWHSRKQKFSKDTEKLAKMLHKIFEYSSDMSMISAKWAMRLRLSAWNKFVTSFDTAMQIVCALVPEMTRVGGDGLLQRMTDEGIRGNDAIRIVADFILAAGDTTASSMQWILLLLSRHPECQEKLYDVIKDLSAKEITRDSLVRGTIKEALRLYPIAPFITRYLPEDSILGDYAVPKHQLLLLSMYSSSRDPANFPLPNDFYPERWIRTEEGSYRDVLHPHGSLPFALGARSCIGRKLAETQMSLALSELVKAFKIDCINKNRINMILHLTAVPSELIKLKLIERDI